MRADSSIFQHFIRMQRKVDRNRFAILANPAPVETIVNASGKPVRERQHTRVADWRKPNSPKAQFIHFLDTAARAATVASLLYGTGNTLEAQFIHFLDTDARAATVASLLYGTGNTLDLQESLHGVFGWELRHFCRSRGKIFFSLYVHIRFRAS
jgi:hypothetical protein